MRELFAVVDVVGLGFRGLAIGLLGVRQIVDLVVSVAQQFPQPGRWRALQNALQRRDRLLRFPFIQQKLRQLLDAILIRRFAREQGSQHGFRLVLLILQAVQAREPQRGIGVRGIQANDFAVLLGGMRERVALPRGVAQIAERAHVDSREQAPRRQIVRVLGQNRLRLDHRVANPLGLVINFGKLVADLLAVWDRA